MKIIFRLTVSLFIFAGLLSACAPAQTADSQVATMVAATLQAQLVPTETAALDGEIQQQPGFGECATVGQLSVAYTKDGNIWLWVRGGAHTQLTAAGDASQVRLSADGCRVAYSRLVPNPAFDPAAEFPQPDVLEELWVVSSNGSDNRLLAGLEFYANLPAPPENSSLTLYRFAWQPGSYTLAFSTRAVFGGPGLLPSNDIHLVAADSLVVSTLLPTGSGGDFYFSHDGQQIAFSTASSINLINTDGSLPRRDLVTFPMILTYSEYQFYPSVYWTPTDNALMVAIPPEDGLSPTESGNPPETSLWYIPLDGSNVFEAGSVQSVWLALQTVQFSPDLGRIAYLRPVGEPELNERELVVALSDGSNETAQLIYPQIAFGSWAPDNTHFIYVYTDSELRLVITDVNNSLVAPIDPPGDFAAGAATTEWVAEDALLLLLQGDAGAQLSLVDPNGGGEVIADFNQPFVSYDVVP